MLTRAAASAASARMRRAAQGCHLLAEVFRFGLISLSGCHNGLKLLPKCSLRKGRSTNRNAGHRLRAVAAAIAEKPCRSRCWARRHILALTYDSSHRWKQLPSATAANALAVNGSGWVQCRIAQLAVFSAGNCRSEGCSTL
jgi:hypothetical protein